MFFLKYIYFRTFPNINRSEIDQKPIFLYFLYELEILCCFSIFEQVFCSLVLGVCLLDLTTGYQYTHTSVWFLTWYDQRWFIIFEELLLGEMQKFARIDI